LPRLVTTPALEPWVSNWITAYRAEHGAPGFEVEVLPLGAAIEAVEDGDAALIISGAEVPGDWFATPLGQEGIAVLVHPDNIVRSYSLSALASIFTGRIRTWQELEGSGGEILPLIPMAGDEMRIRFEDVVMGGAPSTSNAILAPSTAAMIAMIAESPSSIGYAPLSLTSEDVRVVRVDGVLPGESNIVDGTYSLVLEVIAAAPDEPGGAIRDWLGWLQSDHARGAISGD
jgi:phosphate transport system substrate-binding protein